MIKNCYIQVSESDEIIANVNKTYNRVKQDEKYLILRNITTCPNLS